jgi:hypothetical protein
MPMQGSSEQPVNQPFVCFIYCPQQSAGLAPLVPSPADRRRHAEGSILVGGAGDCGLVEPGSEVMAGVDPEHMTLAGAAQHPLDIPTP